MTTPVEHGKIKNHRTILATVVVSYQGVDPTPVDSMLRLLLVDGRSASSVQSVQYTDCLPNLLTDFQFMP